MTVGIRQILSDRGALASTLKASGFAAAELKQAIEEVDAKVISHQQMDKTEDMSTLIERVELKPEGMQIALNLRALVQPDRFPKGGNNLRMTRLVPLQMRRRGIEYRSCSRAKSRLPAQIPPCFERWPAATSGSVN